MKYQSIVKEKGYISFPKFKKEKVYMIPFFKKEGLPNHLNYWQETINQMLKNIHTDNPIYLMIDSTFVKKGECHRRPGLHIDGYWNPNSISHGHTSYPGSHSSLMNSIHGPRPTPCHLPKSINNNWETATFKDQEALVLASNISSSRGFIGEFSGPIRDMGSCEHIKTNNLKEVSLQANKVYAGNVTFLHETLPVKEDCFRTLIRLNIPGYNINKE